MDWFRFYSETIHDSKIRRVARKASQPPVVVIGVWSVLLSMASDSSERGTLLIGNGPVTVEDIEDVTGCNVSETLQEMLQVGMLELNDGIYSIAAWNKRQYQSDNSTPRVNKYRDKVKQEAETLQKRFGNAPDTESDTESDTETESSPSKSDGASKTHDQVKSRSRSGHVTKPAKQEPTEAPEQVQPKTPSAQQGMFGAIADVCHVDPILKKGQIARTAKDMLGAGYTSDQVRSFSRWWKANDFRGQKGQTPTIGQLTENMKKFMESVAPKNGSDPTKPKMVKIEDQVTKEIREVPA